MRFCRGYGLKQRREGKEEELNFDDKDDDGGILMIRMMMGEFS